MSTQLSSEPPRKQAPGVYTVILVLSMLFMIVAVAAMIVELRRWGPEYWETQSAKPQVMLATPHTGRVV